MQEKTGRLGNKHELPTIDPERGFEARSIEDASELPYPDDGTEIVQGFRGMPILLRDRMRHEGQRSEEQRAGQI